MGGILWVPDHENVSVYANSMCLMRLRSVKVGLNAQSPQFSGRRSSLAFNRVFFTPWAGRSSVSISGSGVQHDWLLTDKAQSKHAASPWCPKPQRSVSTQSCGLTLNFTVFLVEGAPLDTGQANFCQ